MASPVSGPRIVLGLDYGTTYTGLAWIQTTGQDDPTLGDLTVFRSWPEMDAQKVPSAYSYSKTSSARRYRQWGYSIDEDSEVMRWTKLELEPRTTVRELEVLRELMKGLDLVNNLRANENAANTNDIPRHISKSAEDVVKDYLSKVSREWYQYMRSQGRYTLDSVPLDIVITHPVSWPYEAKNKTFRAVMAAFHKGMFPTVRNVAMMSEPEACALYTVQDMVMRDYSSLIPGECFVLCDAGGGTVDLVSYRIDSIEPLRLVRVGGVSGGRYGATFIDQAFLEWLQPRLENQDLLLEEYRTGGRFILMPKGRVLLERFERVKHAFSGTESGDISLPRGIVVAAGQGDDLDSGMISLTQTDLKNMFQSSVTGTVRLISRQVTQVENTADGENPGQVTNIFLTGGFSESPYLFNEVKRYANTTSDIRIQRADDCWSGVVKGAVLGGMGIGTEVAVKVNSCPRHYGISVSQIFADWKHNSSKQTVQDHFHGKQVVPEQLIWLIRQGDVILPDEPIVSALDIECRFSSELRDKGQSMRVIFVASDIQNPPSDLEDLPRDQNEVTYLDIDLSSIPRTSLQWSKRSTGTYSYYRVDMSVNFEVSRSVKVTIKCGENMLRTYGTSL